MEEMIIREENQLSRSGITPEELYQRFVAYLDLASTSKTIETYTRAIRQMFAYFADNGITHPEKDDLRAFRNHLKETGHKPTTIQNYIAAAHAFFKWTASENLYDNIADGVKGAKLDRDHKKDYLTSSQVKTVLGDVDRTTPQGLRDYAIIALMVTGGLRTVEVVRANIGDMRTLGDCTVLYVQGKGREEKTEYVKLSAPVEKAIRAYLKTRDSVSPEAPLFTSLSNNSNGERMTTRSISRIAKDSMIEAGYDSSRLTAHSLRHTAVTLALLAGKDITEVQQFARHANISTTQIYNHALEKAKNSCSEAISNAIF